MDPDLHVRQAEDRLRSLWGQRRITRHLSCTYCYRGAQEYDVPLGRGFLRQVGRQRWKSMALVTHM